MPHFEGRTTLEALADASTFDPHSLAIRTPERELSRDQLARLSLCALQWLAQQGVKPKSRVAVGLSEPVQELAMLLALEHLG
jgi:non-ribosomal peptide synthetase component E (peptide arylation enzyme)